LQELRKKHPNWKFKILYTDIEWNSAIANEYVGHGGSPRNLVPANNSNYEGEWICKACGKDKLYDSGKWHCASEAAIAYMLDPRNSTNNSDIFQFMELTYNGCNMETIKTMVSNTFLNNESCINAIVSAAQKYNVKKALLKLKSPSCGYGKVYDGTFSNVLTNRNGITAELLKNNGVEIITIK